MHRRRRAGGARRSAQEQQLWAIPFTGTEGTPVLNAMKVTPTPLADCSPSSCTFTAISRIFLEGCNARILSAMGNLVFVQDNHSRAQRGVAPRPALSSRPSARKTGASGQRDGL